MSELFNIRIIDLREEQVFRSGQFAVTREDIGQFATEFDAQDFHLSDDPATFFGEQVASGWHTASITMRLFVEAMPLEGGLECKTVGEIRWPRPVRPGDLLRVEATVLDIGPSPSNPDTVFIDMLVETFNQSCETVQTMRLTIDASHPSEESS